MAKPDEPANSIDLEALDLGPAMRRARTATFAPNWKSVLAADAAVGLAIVMLGVLATLWRPWIGWPLSGLGIVYLLLVGRRFLQWRWLREQAGL